MIDLELLKLVAPLGSGGVIAFIVLVFYRRDVLRARHATERREDRLVDVIDRNATALEHLATVLQSLPDLVAAKVEHNLRGAIAAVVTTHDIECRRGR